MNAEKFDHQAIEKKWAERWIAEKTFEPDIEHPEKPYQCGIQVEILAKAATDTGQYTVISGSN